MHSRAVRIEETDHVDAQVMLAPIVEKDRLGGSLALVVTGPRSNWIDVTPIILSLRVDLRITVDLRSGCQQDPRLSPLGQAKHVDRPVHGSLGGLDWVALIVHWRRGTCQVVDLIDLDEKRKCTVVPDQLESRVLEQMFDVDPRCGIEVVDAKYLVPGLQ